MPNKGEKMETKPKLIRCFKYKSVSTEGNLCKTIVSVYSDGTSRVNQVFLIPGNLEIPYMNKIYTKMGKSIYVVPFAIKYTSLETLFSGVKEALIKSNITLKDIF